jgi:hypothetical protein
MINRQPKGTPVGGQFAEGRKPAGKDLTEDRLILGSEFSRPKKPYENVYGSKYDQSLDTVEIAKRIRQEVKDAVSNGTLPSDADISVTSQRFAGGSAIDIRVSNWPEATVPQDDSRCEHLPHCRDGYHDHRCPGSSHPSDEATRVRSLLQSIHDSYNYDGSEAMTDYFSVNYYGGVTIDDYRPPLTNPGLEPLASSGSLAELKRSISVGTVLEVTQHPTWTDIVGVRRPVSQVRSGGFSLRTNKNGKETDSFIDFGRASNVVFDKGKSEFSIGDIRYRFVSNDE